MAEPENLQESSWLPWSMPTSLPLLVVLSLVFAVVAVAVQLALIDYAFRKVGIESRYLVGILAASILGSGVNVPVARLRGESVLGLREVRAFGIRYRMPELGSSPDTLVAVNVGGALVPTSLSAYLLWANWHDVGAVLAVVTMVAAVARCVAIPLPGLGIAVPLWIAPLVAAAGTLALAPEAPAAVAYIGGTLGSLIGADLLNLRRIRGLGAPVASIGGAGTFDGIFLAGVLAVLLA